MQMTQPLSELSVSIGDRAGSRILVVDDNVGMATLNAKLLRMLGDHEVEVAYDGPSALRIAADFRPDVILLDISLPGMTGYEVAALLRSDPSFDRTLIVALTGDDTEADRLRSLDAGFDLHLIKPPSIEAIENVLVHGKRMRTAAVSE